MLTVGSNGTVTACISSWSRSALTSGHREMAKTPGSLWVEGAELHYVDVAGKSGTSRVTIGDLLLEAGVAVDRERRLSLLFRRERAEVSRALTERAQ